MRPSRIANPRLKLARTGLLFSAFLAVFFLNTVLIQSSAWAEAATPDADEKVSIGEYFDGEEFQYNIGFWWFEKAAVGKIGIHKQNDGLYKIVLSAETMGFIGFVTSYRKDIYTAYAEETDEGRRFRTKRFEKVVVIGDSKKGSYTEADYNKMTYHWKSWGDGKEDREAAEPIPADVLYDDPLTAFYNFRFGVYGQLKEGKEFYVPTFPRDGVSDIYVRIATNKEKIARINPNPSSVDYLADIRIAKELFGSQTGRVEVRFTEDNIPVYVVAKEIILFGDVRGTLVEMTSRMRFKKEPSK